MKRIGVFVTIPTGSYCHVSLESGEKVIVTHEQEAGGHRARLTLDRVKLLGLISETVVGIDLDTLEGQTLMTRLVEEAASGDSTSLLRRFVSYLQDCRSTAELVSRCEQLRGGRSR